MRIGEVQKLLVSKKTNQGYYLEDEFGDEVLLPNRLAPEQVKIEDVLEVFVYTDSEDLPIASTKLPNVMPNEFGMVTIKHNTSFGAFADWGIDKDLLIPFSEQYKPLKEGQRCLIFVYLDEKTRRLAGSTRYRKFLNQENVTFNTDDEVQIIVAEETPMGYQVIVNKKHLGLLYKNEVFQPLAIGEQRRAYIKTLRSDGKIDLVLELGGYERIATYAEDLLELLKQRGGFIPFHDASNPEDIKRVLKMSKKSFKKALGDLYKKDLIELSEKGTHLK